MDAYRQQDLIQDLQRIGIELMVNWKDPLSLHRVLNNWFRRDDFRNRLSEFCWETDLTVENVHVEEEKS